MKQVKKSKSAYERILMDNLRAENEQLRAIVAEQADALIELAALIEEKEDKNDG